MTTEPADIVTFEPNDLLEIERKPMPAGGANATVTITITSVSPTDFRFSTAVDVNGSPLPMPGDGELNSSLDLDFVALGLAGERIIALHFVLADSSTVMRSRVPFTTNRASKTYIFITDAQPNSAKLWVKAKKSSAKRVITYNIHFLTKNKHDDKIIEWALDPKVRNEG